MRLRVSLTAMVIALVAPVCAQASTVTTTYNFTADTFTKQSLNSDTIPFDPVTGSFTLTYDPAVSSGGSIVFSSSLPWSASGNYAYTYDASDGYLLIGDTASGSISNTAEGTNDLLLSFDHFGAADPGAFFKYTTSQMGSQNNAFDTHSVTVTAVTPIPATLPLLATGILALAGFGFYQSRCQSKLGAAAALSA